MPSDQIGLLYFGGLLLFQKNWRNLKNRIDNDSHSCYYIFKKSNRWIYSNSGKSQIIRGRSSGIFSYIHRLSVLYRLHALCVLRKSNRVNFSAVRHWKHSPRDMKQRYRVILSYTIWFYRLHLKSNSIIKESRT